MLDYIKENATWIFSGIGVTALTVLFFFLRGLFKKEHPQKQKVSGSSVGIQAGRDANVVTKKKGAR
ncbi:hypothetical protein [Marinobacter algicola]|uniref:hypothetical protein n=1 Tax=Marinobacter algicola TaxID=236100 RepID=UPI0003036B3E|nr:hypothetical protein [Marinobacter algicola]